MAVSTEEVAQVILAALQAEQNRQPDDVRGRRSLGLFTKELMARHHWSEMEFLQGWGLIMSEKLAEVRRQGEGFYANLTDAGRAFMEEEQDKVLRLASRQPLLSGDQVYFIIKLVAIAAILGYMFWKADH